MVTGLRSFFRFARLRGLIASDLAAVVPANVRLEMAGPPSIFADLAVQRVLVAWRRSTGIGKRDYAALLFLARLGLRAGEIVALQLDDIDWNDGQLAVRSKKGNGWARLPLPIDVSQAQLRCEGKIGLGSSNADAAFADRASLPLDEFAALKTSAVVVPGWTSTWCSLPLASLQ